MNILVTGSNGFIGQAICTGLAHDGHEVIRIVRFESSASEIAVGEINECTNWARVLGNQQVDTVIHVAAKLPPQNSQSDINNKEFFDVNSKGTSNLALKCAKHGVRRFIFLSTTKVLGESSDEPFHADDPAIPADDYAKSKWNAEQSLWQISRETGMEVVILRPPIVYGPGVKGNFLKMMYAVDKRMPFPFGSVHNRRSLIYVENLVDAVRTCLTHPEAAGHTWMVSDNDDVSTAELIRRIAYALGRPALLFSIPVGLMNRIGKLIGKEPNMERLVGSLYVDTSPIQNELGWWPPFTMQQGLKKTATWYRQTFNRIS